MADSENLFDHYLAGVQHYMEAQCWEEVPGLSGRSFTVTPLARGEYNLNYLLTSEELKLVFRLNIGTQINRDDQIVYEYKALQLLQNSGVTPVPYFVDDSRSLIDRGISIMEYLPGCSLDYRLDLAGAAKTLATIHQLEVDATDNHLIIEKEPLSMIFYECKGLLEKYLCADLAKPDIRRFLGELIEWAGREKTKEKYFLEDPWLCIVNTEVNSGNFIVNREKNTTHLIDWEMVRWGDPSTDLCHFCSPFTTLWKTGYRFSPDSQSRFINEYLKNIRSPHLRDSLEDRMRIKYPFVLLRGISWSAMGWVAYQTDYHGIRNEDTWRKLNQYLELDFIRSIFQPFMKN
jgi:hypothetical protein